MNYKVFIISLLIGIPSFLQLYVIGGKLASETGFDLPAMSKTDKASVLSEPTKTEVSFLPERIVMDKANIDLPVVYAPLKNGTWEVTPKVANYAEGTSQINQKEGNVGIFGHARKDAFLRIKQLQPKDEVIVYGKGYKATYTVASIDKVAPDAVEVFYPQKEPTLTLTTCEGRFDEQRYVVKAKLIRIDKAVSDLTYNY